MADGELGAGLHKSPYLSPSLQKAMDPHSRLSQYNHRPPKAGPPTQNTRTILTDKKKQTVPCKQQFDTSSLLLVARPIATNSRVKRNQKLHRDMHLAFIDNALEGKSQVRVSPPSLLAHQPTLDHRGILKILTSWSASSISRASPTRRSHRVLS